MVQKRLERTTRLLNDLKNKGESNSHFSDEKAFIVDHVVNKQNDRKNKQK